MFISISDICAYAKVGIVKAGCTTRPLEQGEQLYLAGHVVVHSVKEQVFTARCITSKVNANPHEIKIKFGDFSDITTWQCNCSCKAGAGQRCKHIIATLIFIYNVKELPELSCTETEQAWGKRKKRDLTEIVPSEEFCHVSYENGNNSELILTKEFKDEFLAQCFSAHPQSEISQFSKGRHLARIQEFPIRNIGLLKVICDHAKNSPYNEFLYNMDINFLHHCCMETYNKLYPCDVFNMCLLTLDDEDKWMQERQFRITGTRCYSLFTYSKDDWSTKSISFFYPKSFKGNYATQYGKQEEANARNLYESYFTKNEKIVKYGLAISPNNPWLACSPDGVLLSSGIPLALIEIKCPVIGKTKNIMDCIPDLNYMNRTSNGYTLNPKHSYFAQVQLGMCILNLKVCHFVLYSSFDKSIFIENIELDENFCKILLAKLKNIFFEKMLHTLCNSIE